MLKKFALVLAVFMIFSLSACGGETSSQPDVDTPVEDEEVTSTELGFQDAAQAQSFVDNFNSETDGYAYLAESDAQTLEGVSFQEQGYSVYRILIWRDKTQGMEMEAQGDFTGSDAGNNLNVRLIYDPNGRLVLFKTFFTLSNSTNLAKTDDALSCDAMMRVLAALFPQNTEEQNHKVYEDLRLPAVEAIGSFESTGVYDSSIDLIEDFFTHCGYEVDPDGMVGAIFEYDCGGTPYRLICSPYGEYQDDLFAIYWDVALTTPDDVMAYESAMLSIMA